MWFNTCDDKNFYIFCRQQATAGGESLCISADGNSKVTLLIKLNNNGVDETYKKTTSLSIQSGWNFIGIACDETFEYTTCTVYHAHDNNTPV